jgi:hypothetical protein
VIMVGVGEEGYCFSVRLIINNLLFTKLAFTVRFDPVSECECEVLI